MDKRQEVKVQKLNMGLLKTKSLFEIKKNAFLQEEYTRSTLQGMYNNMQSELQKTKKEIITFVELNKRSAIFLDKERLNNTGIKETVNKIHNKMTTQDKVFIFI